MAKRKGGGRRAYLNKPKSFYDPYSDYALRTRGQKVIDLISPVPPSLMRSQERENVRLLWQSMRHQRLTDYHRVALIHSPKYELDLFFHGREFYFIQEDKRKRVLARSKCYHSREQAMHAFDRNNIYWAEVEDMPLEQNSVPPS